MNNPTPSDAADDKPAAKPKLVTFHRMIPTARMPQRADRSAAGSLPTRAFRYCEAATSAAAFGYYLFPPIGFSVQWDGHDIMWTFEGAGDWFPLNSAVQFPGFRDYFDRHRPGRDQGILPALPRRAAGTRADPALDGPGGPHRARAGACWSARPPICRAAAAGKPFEGIIETDRWFGPLITNLRLTKTNVPIDFKPDFPLLQVQPIPRHVYEDATLNNYEIVPELDPAHARGLGRLLRYGRPAELAGCASARPIRGRGPQAAQCRGRNG